MDGCDSPWLLAGGIEVGQGPGRGGARRCPGRPRSSCPLSVSRRATRHEGGSARRPGLPRWGRSSVFLVVRPSAPRNDQWAAGCVLGCGWLCWSGGFVTACRLVLGLALCLVPGRRCGDVSGLCTGLGPGGSVVGGLASGGVHHWCGLCRSLGVAPAGFCPGARPACPGPAHRRASAVVFQVPGEPGGGVPGCRGPGRGGRSSCPSSSGACGPPCRSPRTPGAGAACGRPSGVPDHLPGTAARQRSPGRSGPSPGSGTGGCRPPTSSRACRRREPAPGPGQDHETPGPAARAVAPGPLGGAAAWRAPSARAGAHRLAVHAPAPPRPQGRRGAPVPAGFRPRHRAQS